MMTQKDVNELYSRRYMTLTEAGKMLGSSRQYLNELVRKGKITVMRVDGKPYVYSESVLDHAIARKRRYLRLLNRIRLPDAE